MSAVAPYQRRRELIGAREHLESLDRLLGSLNVPEAHADALGALADWISEQLDAWRAEQEPGGGQSGGRFVTVTIQDATAEQIRERDLTSLRPSTEDEMRIANEHAGLILRRVAQ